MKNLSILVVDDDPVVLHLLEQRLKKENYQVQGVADGYAAERLLRQQFFDVVLTDLKMPGEIGGIEVLEIAKEVNASTEVLLITAHSSVHSAVAAMKKGAADYLEKPINFDELFLRLDKIANLKSILRTAEDLQLAMRTTETAASSTIQELEIGISRLRQKLDRVATVLKEDHLTEELRIKQALAILAQD
jgi:two-component system, OmpR family, response regulator